MTKMARLYLQEVAQIEQVIITAHSLAPFGIAVRKNWRLARVRKNYSLAADSDPYVEVLEDILSTAALVLCLSDQ
jgi:hypothetical protein